MYKKKYIIYPKPRIQMKWRITYTLHVRPNSSPCHVSMYKDKVTDSRSPSLLSPHVHKSQRRESPLLSFSFPTLFLIRHNSLMASRDKKHAKPSSSRSGGVRTLSDLNRLSGPDSDSDSDSPQEYYTGGEKRSSLFLLTFFKKIKK